MKTLNKKIMLLIGLFVFSFVIAGGVFAEDIVIDQDTTWPAATYTYDNVHVTNGATLTFDGKVTLLANSLTITGGCILTHSGATLETTSHLELEVDTLTIDETSAIDVTAKGYRGSRSGRGRTLGNLPGSDSGAGGSYGGWGGEEGESKANPSYGDYTDPDELGSGAGGWTWSHAYHQGGNGGGLVRIKASEITLNGSIRSDGDPGRDFDNPDWGPGGGSGGGIYIETGTLSGIGLISANGGSKRGGGSGRNGGGGGRIAIYYDDISGFDVTNIAAIGGAGGKSGGAGTVFLKSSAQAYGELVIDNNGISAADTPLPAVDTGILCLDSLTVAGKAEVKTTDDILIEAGGSLTVSDARLQANGISVGATAELAMPNATLDLGESLTFDVAVLDSEALTINGRIEANSLTLDNKTLTVSGRIEANNLSLLNKTVLASFDTTTETIFRLEIEANNLTIDATSTIDVTGRGYRGSRNGPGWTLGNLPGSDSGAGGSYGGWGGKEGESVANATYGDYTNPNELGSGAGGWTWTHAYHQGGDGGGLVRIKASEIFLNGAIKADGDPGRTWDNPDFGDTGGGSGGGIYIETGSLAGTGTISANGGPDDRNGGGGGVLLSTTMISLDLTLQILQVLAVLVAETVVPGQSFLNPLIRPMVS